MFSVWMIFVVIVGESISIQYGLNNYLILFTCIQLLTT